MDTKKQKIYTKFLCVLPNVLDSISNNYARNNIFIPYVMI